MEVLVMWILLLLLISSLIGSILANRIYLPLSMIIDKSNLRFENRRLHLPLVEQGLYFLLLDIPTWALGTLSGALQNYVIWILVLLVFRLSACFMALARPGVSKQGRSDLDHPQSLRGALLSSLAVFALYFQIAFVIYSRSI